MIFIVCITGILIFLICRVIFLRKFLLDEMLELKLQLYRHDNGTYKLSEKRLKKIFSRLNEIYYLLDISEEFKNEKN